MRGALPTLLALALCGVAGCGDDDEGGEVSGDSGKYKVKNTGALEVSADQDPSSLDYSSAIGRLRLSASSRGA